MKVREAHGSAPGTQAAGTSTCQRRREDKGTRASPHPAWTTGFLRRGCRLLQPLGVQNTMDFRISCKEHALDALPRAYHSLYTAPLYAQPTRHDCHRYGIMAHRTCLHPGPDHRLPFVSLPYQDDAP